MKSITCDLCGIDSKDSNGWVLAKKDLCPACVVELREALGQTLKVNKPGQHIPVHLLDRNPLLDTDFGQGIVDNGGAIGRNFDSELRNLRFVTAEKRRKL